MKSEFQKIAEEIKHYPSVIRLISHLDTDGITSAAIISKALARENKKFCLSVVSQLSDEKIYELSLENYEFFVFTDFGSGQLEYIVKHFPKKRIIILDHHEYDKTIHIPKNITLINPHKHGIDGAKDISGAGMTYFFSLELNEKNKELAHLAILGAIGDIQNDFSELHEKILKDAISIGKLKKEKTINWFGLESRPIIRNLVYGEIAIPGISNDSDAVMFLESIGIEPKKQDEWKSFSDLDNDEKEKLVASIIMKRKDLENSDDIFVTRYVTQGKGQFKDLKEFSTLLNACGRLEKASYGIGACLEDEKSMEKALETSLEYKKEISNALRWYRENPDKIIKTEKYIIINAKDSIKPTIIGTLASILSNDSEIKEKTIIISLAYDGNNIKISSRIKGNFDLDLRDIIKKILMQIDGEGGGHKNAAGAIISIDQEKDFINHAVKVLDELEF